MVRFVLVATAAVVLVAGCGRGEESTSGSDESDESGETGAVTVAGFDFAESELLAELYAQALESEAVPVTRLGQVGPREIVAPAMELGHIDIVAEYVGTALQYAGSTEPNPDSESAFEELKTRLASKDLVALALSPAEDSNAVVVTAEVADTGGLDTISDLRSVADDWIFGGPAECPDRPLCLVGLEAVYGLRFAEFVPQRSLAFTAEALRRGEIDAGLMFTSAAELEAPDLVELTDDLQLQPAENIVPVVRSEVVEQWGSSVTDPLEAVSAALTTDELRAMNVRVARGDPVPEVASDWLLGHELLDR